MDLEKNYTLKEYCAFVSQGKMSQRGAATALCMTLQEFNVIMTDYRKQKGMKADERRKNLAEIRLRRSNINK